MSKTLVTFLARCLLIGFEIHRQLLGFSKVGLVTYVYLVRYRDLRIKTYHTNQGPRLTYKNLLTKYCVNWSLFVIWIPFKVI